jgi:hypothetical protein
VRQRIIWLVVWGNLKIRGERSGKSEGDRVCQLMSPQVCEAEAQASGWIVPQGSQLQCS